MQSKFHQTVAFIILVIAMSYVPIANASPGLDVNDVSILFPIKHQKPYPAINLLADQLLPSAIFEQVLRFEDRTFPMNRVPYLDGKFVGDMKRWYVTSMRLDPCGEVFELQDEIDSVDGQIMHLARRGPGCQARLRLVVQPFNLFGNPLATAIHLLFKVDGKEMQGIIDDLMKLKKLAVDELAVDTTGLPLMLHPALVAEAKTSKDSVAMLLRTSLLKALNPPVGPRASERLEIVTLTLQVAIDHWKFVGGYVQKGSWQRFVTEFSKQFNDGSNSKLARGIESLKCDRHSVCFFLPTFQPAKLQFEGLVLTQIFQDLPDMKALQVPGYRTAALQIDSERIDNPSETHFFNTNCVSCHASANLRDRDKFHTSIVTPNGVTPFVPKLHLTSFTNGVINFGYWGTIARVSTRTAADSVVAADALNREFGYSNPAANMSNLEKFWKCLVSSTDYKTCL